MWDVQNCRNGAVVHYGGMTPEDLLDPDAGELSLGQLSSLTVAAAAEIASDPRVPPLVLQWLGLRSLLEDDDRHLRLRAAVLRNPTVTAELGETLARGTSKAWFERLNQPRGNVLATLADPATGSALIDYARSIVECTVISTKHMAPIYMVWPALRAAGHENPRTTAATHRSTRDCVRRGVRQVAEAFEVLGLDLPA